MMEKSDNNSERKGTAAPRGRRRGRSFAGRVLRGVLWTGLVVVLLFVILCTSIVVLLPPGRLTPLVNKYASEYLDADVDARRVELTFWSSFPKLSLAIDSLRVTSRSLKGLSPEKREALPADADSLLFVRSVAGGVNVARLATGRIELCDLVIDGPQVNIVVVDSCVANFNIVPSPATGVQVSPVDDSPLSLPDISIDRFRILNAGPISYFSLPDSTSVSVNISTIDIAGDNAPRYDISLAGNVSMPILEELRLMPLRLGVDGGIKWEHDNPGALTLDELEVSADSLTATVSGEFDFSGPLAVKKFEALIKSADVGMLLSHIPAGAALRRQFDAVDTDMTVDMAVELTKPYFIGDTVSIPSANVMVEIPDCRFHYRNARFNRFSALVSATIDGDSLDRSTINVERFIINGRAIDTDITASVTSIMSDPAIAATFKGNLRIDRLPDALLAKLPVSLTGRLRGDASVRMRLSDLHRDRFHRLRMKGALRLDNFSLQARDSSLSAMTGAAEMRFGTSNRFVRGDRTIDSMLTVSLSADTASVDVDGISLRIRDLKAGAGSVNKKSSADTSVINPFGGVIKIGRMSLKSEPDSLMMRVVDADCRAALRRFHGDDKVPQLGLDVSARRIFMRQPDLRAMLSQPSFDVTAHIRPRRQIPDSVRRQRRSNAAAGSAVDDGSVKLEVDSGVKALLRRWNVEGNMKLAKARVFMPVLPLRQHVDSLDMYFTTDSISLSNLRYSIGRSNMTVTGRISNLQRSLTSRRRVVKLKLDLDMHARYIDINELARAVFTEAPANDIAVNDDNFDESGFDDTDTMAADTLPPRPLLIPRNLDAKIDITADSVLYTDLMLQSFQGKILVDNSAVNLADLSARTEIGDINLTALYSAPDTADMQFGMGMKVNNFHIDKMINLIPAIDSLLPVMRDFSGVINADLAATSAISPSMDFEIPSLKAALKLDGDSLVLLDADTFKTLSKWLMFKNKKHNMIDHMSVEIVVDNSQVELFPFMFDIDRYRLGVMGRNDMSMNLDYHVSVLKSPLPFKFGINIKGNIDDMKIRLGGAKFKENAVYDRFSIADTTRINLLNQIENVFRRGAKTPPRLNVDRRSHDGLVDERADSISASDSLLMISSGFIVPDSLKQEHGVSDRPEESLPPH